MIGLGQPPFELIFLALAFTVGYRVSGRERFMWLAVGTLVLLALAKFAG